MKERKKKNIYNITLSYEQDAEETKQKIHRQKTKIIIYELLHTIKSFMFGIILRLLQVFAV